MRKETPLRAPADESHAGGPGTREVLAEVECLEAIIDAATDSIVIFDDRGVIGSANPAVATMFGYAPRDVLGHNIRVLLPPAHGEEEPGALFASQYPSEREARRRDGSTFPVDVSVSAVHPPRIFAGIIRDVSQRKRFEQQLARVALAEQERIGRDLHDTVCQDLAGLALVAERAGHSLAGTAAEPSLHELAEGIRVALATVRTVARGLTVMATDAATLTLGLEELAASVRRHHGIPCIFAAGPGLRLRKMEANHLFRIAAEAVANAVHHASPQSVTIRLVLEGRRTVLRVHDDGTGIADDACGRGIGLWVMRHRARAAGATLDIRRASEGGTTVTCTVKERHDGRH